MQLQDIWQRKIQTTRATRCLSRFFQVLAVLCITSISGQLHAQVYGGFVAGISSATNNGDIADDNFPPIEDATGYKVSIGNSLSPILAYEISYVDLGDYEVGNAPAAIVDPQEQSDQISVVGFDASLVGNFAMTQKFALYTKIGVMAWRAERTLVVIDDVTLAETVEVSEFNETDVSAGIGVSFDFTRSIGFNVEANAYKTDDVYNLLYGAGFFITF